MTKSNTLMSPRLGNYFKDYALYHKTAGNKWTHYFGITMILVSLLGLLAQWEISPEVSLSYLRLDAGVALVFLGALFYVWVDWKIALPFTLVLAGLYFLGRLLSTPVNWTLFIGGWIFQFIGHAVFEKKSPAFFRNLTHVLIGPLWIFAKMIGYK